VPTYVLLIISFFLLISTAICYFYKKISAFSITLLLFFSCNVYISALLLYDNLVLFFYTIILLFVLCPVACLILFVIDVYSGLFCTDTSFIIVLVWLLLPAFFITNTIVFGIKWLSA